MNLSTILPEPAWIRVMRAAGAIPNREGRVQQVLGGKKINGIKGQWTCIERAWTKDLGVHKILPPPSYWHSLSRTRSFTY